MSLTDAHKDAIRKSWALVATDVKGNGVAIFLRLFKDYPSMKEYFPAFRNKTLEQLADSPVLRAHGSAVVFSLASVIDSLDDVECMSELWKKVVISHEKRGVDTMELYQNVFKTVLNVLSEALGAAGAFDDLTKEGWIIGTGIMQSQIEANLKAVKSQKA